jgi:hypothetical protein
MTRVPLLRKPSFGAPPLATSPIQLPRVLGVPICSCCRTPGRPLELRRSAPSVICLHSDGPISPTAYRRRGNAFYRVSQPHACSLCRMTCEPRTFHPSGSDGRLCHLGKRPYSPCQEPRPVEWQSWSSCLNTILPLQPLATIRGRWRSMTRFCFGCFVTTLTSRFQTSCRTRPR